VQIGLQRKMLALQTACYARAQKSGTGFQGLNLKEQMFRFFFAY